MPSIPQFWQTLRPLRKVGKLRGIIEIPVFTTNCGPANYSRQWFGSYFDGTAGAPAGVFPLGAITYEAWVKPLSGIIGTTKAYIFSTAGITDSVLVNADRTVSFRLRTTAAANTIVTSARQLSINTWNHVACTWDGTTMRIYINFVLDTNTGAVAGTLSAVPGAIYHLLDYFNGGVSSAAMKCNELRIWNVARTLQQIIAAAHGPRDIGGTIDVGLVGYWPLNEGAGTTITNKIAANAFTLTYTTYGPPDSSQWDLVDSYPYKLGASFYPIVFPIDSGGKVYSLKFPLKKPYASVNFVPCIRWVVDGVVYRYKLWNAITGFDVAPEPADYRGQRIPDGAKLEIWNLDGMDTVDLTQVIDMETSILHVVDDANTVAQTADAAITADNSIAEPFPLTPFPLQFNDTQSYS